MIDDDPVHDAALEMLRPLLPPTAADVAALTAPGVLIASAAWYALLGWPVFPLRPFQKVPAVAGGFQAATTDPDTIAAWWDRWPLANIGTPTGITFDVIDIDAPDGFETWAAHEEAWRAGGYSMPATLAISYTASGGKHLFIAPQGGGNSAGLGKGVDYRGRGGYVVLPPSRLSNGVPYRWITTPQQGQGG